MLIGAAILYFVLLITLGVVTVRKRHWVLFGVGFVFPVLWLIGAIMQPAPRR